MKTETFNKFSNVNRFCDYFWKYDKTILYKRSQQCLCTSIGCDLINCCLCRIQRMEIMKIFIKESKIMNDSNLQLNYFILLELSIAQLFFFFFVTLFRLNQKYLQMQRTRLAIIMKKQGIRKKLLLAKTKTARRSCWVKKDRTNAWWENFITNKVQANVYPHLQVSLSFLQFLNQPEQIPLL